MAKLFRKDVKQILAMVNSIPAPTALDIDRARVAAITCKSTKEFCDFLELDPISFKHWCIKYPAYERAVMSWRTHATNEIELAMAKRAIGFTKTTKRDVITKNGVETLINETYYPPSETAGQFWLKNRAPNDWQDKKEIDVNVNANIRAWLVAAGGQLDPSETLDVSPGSLIANETESLIANDSAALIANQAGALTKDQINSIIEAELVDNTQADLEANLMAELEAEAVAGIEDDSDFNLVGNKNDPSPSIDASSSEIVSSVAPSAPLPSAMAYLNAKWS
jgi:hypothetical protein